MQKRLSDRDKLHAKIERLTENQIDQLLSMVRTMEKNRTDSGASEHDELLDKLCAEVENRRAVQVFEWESTRRRAESRVTGFPRAV